jgi:hypothetical protein
VQARFGERRLKKGQPQVETSSTVYSTYRWSNGVRSSLHALSDSTGIDHLLECSRNAGKVGLIQGGENTLSRFVENLGNC